MQVTKYPQSCLLVKNNGPAILIDPGTLFSEGYQLSQLGLIEGIFYTHQHFGHFDESLLGDIRAADIEIFCNQDVAEKIKGDVNVVKDKETFVCAGFSVTPYDLPHCKMQDGSDGPPNTGYLIGETFFHPGDGVELAGLTVGGLALPIAGPSIDFENAAAFADQVSASKILPIHYDVFEADPEKFARSYGDNKVIVLKDGESADF